MNSLTVVDLFSGWTVNRAIWKKETRGTLNQIKKVEARLPFNLVEFFSDNGNEFINFELQKYFEQRSAPVHFKITRAYKKMMAVTWSRKTIHMSERCWATSGWSCQSL